MKTPDDALLCPITLELFCDPVMAQDGHTYERNAIEEWIRKNGTSPITSKPLSSEHLLPNFAIKKMVDHFENSLRDKNFHYTLDVDVKKKKARPLFTTDGKTIYHAEWLPTNDGLPEIILLKIDGARANKEASFYVDLSRHSHIVRTFGLVHEEDGDRNSIILLQEYAPEGSLHELLTERKKPLDERILIEIFLQVIDAMSYLALNNVVHADLACRNILVFRFDEKDPRNIVVKITDFGLSRYSKIYSQVATAARTTLNIIPIRYCAPEILSANITANDYTEKTDVYSMGVLMWEAYSRGAIPWTNIENDDDVVRRVKNGDMLPQPTNCSPQYWNIITKTWNPSPNQRPTFDQLKILFQDQIHQTTTSASKSNVPPYWYLDSNNGNSENQSTTHINFDPIYMLDQIVEFGKDSFIIKAHIPCGNKQFFALECERPMIGYDGKCPQCNTEHIKLAKSRGYYAPVDSVYAALEQQQLQIDNSQGASAVTKNQPTTSINSNHGTLLDTVVKFGKDSFIIKAYMPCGNKELFALECERPMIGYDGKCPQCNTEHIKLAKSRGYYAPVDSVYDALEQQKLQKNRLQGRKTIEELDYIKNNVNPLDHPILGINKGIEGDSNSCYMDATIFCMFAYSGVFDSLLHMPVDNNLSIKTLQKLLRENIVNILRSETGFVERDALFHLRAQLIEATGDQSFKEMKKEPSEFLRALENLFHYAPLKTIPPDQPPNDNQSNITTNIMWEMFDANPQKLPSTNIASIFRNSLSEIPAKLATIPPFLILVAPRYTRSQRSYRYIIPNHHIDLDNNIVQLFCLKCKTTNHDSESPREFYSCDECYRKDPSSSISPAIDAYLACYCNGCLKDLHKELSEKQRPEHKPKQLKTIKHKLNLFAVLCIETSHYVAFVKCRNRSQQHEWLFFDSMSDRIYDEKNVSRVDRVPDFDEWIDRAQSERYFFDDLDARRNQARPTSQAFDENGMRQLRLFRDGALFFYENPSSNYQ